MSDKKYPFGIVVRERRLQQGLTQEALAERAGVSLRWIQFLESGEQPSITSFLRLADGLECEAGLLLRDFQAAWREAGREKD